MLPFSTACYQYRLLLKGLHGLKTRFAMPPDFPIDHQRSRLISLNHSRDSKAKQNRFVGIFAY